MRPPGCRRRDRRYTFPDGVSARVEFDYPEPGGQPCSMRLRDLSAAGMSVEMACDLPGLETGRTVRHVTVHVDGRPIRGEFLVMHVTPDSGAGSAFGALFYPASDDDILALRRTIADLESADKAAAKVVG